MSPFNFTKNHFKIIDVKMSNLVALKWYQIRIKYSSFFLLQTKKMYLSILDKKKKVFMNCVNERDSIF